MMTNRAFVTRTLTRTAGEPYPGSRPFQHAERDRFYGRAADAAALADLWQSNHLTFAVGPVACGKTSLLHAGVLPLVTGRRFEVLPPGRVSYGSTFPSAALPEHNPYTFALLRSWSPAETATRLAGLTVRDFVRRLAGRHDGVILAAIDQAEELLADSGARWRYRRQFLAELAVALQQEPRLHLLLSVREEAIGPLADALGHGARQLIMPLTPQQAFEAVTGPVAGTGRSYAAEVAERLVTDLRTSRVVPAGGVEQHVLDDRIEPALLQVVCARLWDSLTPDVDVITVRELCRYGEADAALAAHCGRVIAAVADDHAWAAADHDMSPSRLRSWMIGTFITEHGTRGYAYEGVTDTAGMPNAVVRALQDRHLVSAERRAGTRWYRLLSDRLVEPLRHAADEWPSPTKPTEHLRAAERALALGELDVAGQYAGAALRTSPETDLRLRAEANSLLGNLADERGRQPEAEAHYSVAAALFEVIRDTAAVAWQLAAVGQTLLAQDRLAEAVNALGAAVNRMPKDPILQTQFGRALWQIGEGRTAVAILTDVLRIDGGNAGALRVRGEILADLGDARAALVDLDRVAAHDRPSTRAARGLALAELGDPTAGKEIEDALTEAPRNGLVLLFAARAAALSGDEPSTRELAGLAVGATDPALTPQHRDAALRMLAGRTAGLPLDQPPVSAIAI